MRKWETTKEKVPDEMVEQEIERLLNSDAVKLAKKEQRILNRRRQYMYSLRCLEKRGKMLEIEGYTLDNIEEKMFVGEEDDYENY